MDTVHGTPNWNLQFNAHRAISAFDQTGSTQPAKTGSKQFTRSELGGTASAMQLRSKASVAEIHRMHLGPNLGILLGDADPLDGAVTISQRHKMKRALESLRLKAELAVVDEHGHLNQLDQWVFDEVYAPNFPAHEAISLDTIVASLRDRKKEGRHLDGRRFTLCFTGLLPGEIDHKDKRRPVAFSQGGTLDAGNDKCISYAEYWATNEEFRGRGILDVLMGFNCAVSQAVAKKEGKELIGTFWEMEPIGTGADEEARRYSKSRAAIYGRKDACAIMGMNKSGDLLPHHVQPDVTATGESGLVPLHLVYRPQNQKNSSLDCDTLRHIGSNYNGYFNEWARINAQSGINPEKVGAAATYKNKLALEFTGLRLVPADQSPTAMEMARDNPLIARTVAEHFNIRVNGNNHQAMNYEDPFVRLEIWLRSACMFDLETAFAAVYKPR